MKPSQALDFMYKIATLKDLECEQCGYTGQPLDDGRCPDCGSLCGLKAKDTPFESGHNDYSRNMSAMQMYDTLSRAQQENSAIHTMI